MAIRRWCWHNWKYWDAQGALWFAIRIEGDIYQHLSKPNVWKKLVGNIPINLANLRSNISDCCIHPVRYSKNAPIHFVHPSLASHRKTYQKQCWHSTWNSFRLSNILFHKEFTEHSLYCHDLFGLQVYNIWPNFCQFLDNGIDCCA